MCRDIFGYHNWERRSRCYWHLADAAKHPRMNIRGLQTKNYPTQNIISFSKCGPWISNIDITWVPIRNSDS